MTQAVRSAQLAPRRPTDRFDARRDELARAALGPLGEIGYARATLREVAVRARLSHGILGYYFADKIDLIAHCVRLQQGRCATVLDGVAGDAVTAEDLLQRFVDALAAVLRDAGPAQRLWYDLRLESLFEPSIREEVAAIELPVRDAIWRVVERYAALCGRRVMLDHDATYAVIDGVVAHLVTQQAAGTEGLEWLLAERIRALLPRLLVVVD